MLIAAGLLAHAFFVPISIAGTQIGLGVALLGILAAVLQGARLRPTPLDLPTGVFVAVCILSDVWSPFGPPPLSYATLWRSLAGLLIVTHGLSLLDEDARVRMVSCTAAGLALAALVGLIQYRTGVDVLHALHLRASPAAVEAPGVDGRFGAMGFFLSRLTFGHNAGILVAMLAGVGRPRWTLVAAGLGAVAVALTFDRAAYLGLAAAAIVLLAMSTRRARPWLGAALVMVLCAGALHPGIRNRFRSSFDAGRNADRVFIWERAREIVADHPLRGIGFGNYPRVCPAYYDRVDPRFPMRTWAHNTFLSLYAETGPFGLAAFVWLLVAIARGARRQPGALAALATFIVIAQFHDVLYDTKVMYALWLAVGLLLRPQTSWAGSAAPARAGGRTSP
jgi:O-antigen ligase